MLRWRLTLGLLATLIILLLVGVYGVWLYQDLGRAVDRVLRHNYDSIKVCHFMRVATARVNTFYAKGDRPAPPYDQTETLDEAERQFQHQLPILERNAKRPEEEKLVDELKAAATEYIQNWRKIFTLFKANDPAIREARFRIPELTLRITNLSEAILQRNEQQMLIANRTANQQAKDSIRLLIIAMTSAVIVFIFTYSRLGHSIITPIRNLTQSIRYLRSRDFDRSLPVGAHDELGELTGEFNTMAQELRSFYRETDRKFIELNQVIRAMMTTLPYPLFILDEADKVARMNPAAEKLMASLKAKDRLPGQIRKHLAQASITGPDYRLDDLKQALLFRIDEQEIYFLPRIFSIALEDGTVSGRALMLIDVTRFRWLDEMKSDMLSTLSHEIRTPLTGIRLVLHLLLEKRMGPLSSAQEELVSSACNDCERLLKTLSSILDLARMESGKAQLNIKPISPQEILEDAFTTFRDQAEAAMHPLQVELQAALPSIAADRDRLSLVMSNFISNALKYSAPKSAILLRASSAGSEYVRFSVVNEGPGLAEEERARVFDKFYRSDKQRGEGAGLGLTIARQIVQAHDGRIGVNSELNKLTEFYCDLPIAEGAPASGPSTP
ncbi:MAG: ATP-binding protein [Chthoniobacterales bacterium]